MRNLAWTLLATAVGMSGSVALGMLLVQRDRFDYRHAGLTLGLALIVICAAIALFVAEKKP